MIIGRIIIALFLLLLAWFDLKSKRIPIVAILGTGICSIVYGLLVEMTVTQMLLGCIPGLVSLILSFVTKEKIGKGDGFLLLALGVGCGLEQTLALWGTALFIAAVISIVLLVMKKATRRTELPFVPFLLGGYVICQLISS